MLDPALVLPAAEGQVMLAGGNLYLSAALSAAVFPNVDSVALMYRDGRMLVLPLQAASGGLLLKRRNAKGDRVIHAQEFCRFHGLPEGSAGVAADAHWDEGMQALAIDLCALPATERL